MAASSSSLLRTISVRSSFRPTSSAKLQPRHIVQCRSFHSSSRYLEVGGGSNSKDQQHATDKPDQLDIQSEQVGKSTKAKAQGDGGNATSQSDSQNATAKARKEYPEAPDTIIGMQDERGGKGG